MTKNKKHKVLQLLSMMFYIMQFLNDFFIINPPKLYIFQFIQLRNHSSIDLQLSG